MNNKILYSMILSFLMLGVLISCSETIGEQVELKALGYKECKTNADCDPFGFCNEDGFCDSNCRKDADCTLFHDNWEDYKCIDYQCVDITQGVDGDSSESISGECKKGVIEGTSCKLWTPEECGEYGWMSFCADRACKDDGWSTICNKDGKCENTCEMDYGKTDTGNIKDYSGIWAGMFTTAVRNNGLPLVGFQDTVSVHYTLAKIWESEGKMNITHRICYLGLYNFKKDQIFYDDIAVMVTPEPYYEAVSLINHVVDNPPKMEKGEKFETSDFLEIRGAKLEDRVNEALPTQEDYENGDKRVWDQDNDGKPAMTTFMKGAINGEVYSDQRWTTKWNAEILSKDRMWGLNIHTSETHNLDATHETLMTKITTVPHEDDDRSYYRLQRVKETYTCKDVLTMVEDEKEWLRFTPRMDPEKELVLPEKK